jgi:hypothetical protein
MGIGRRIVKQLIFLLMGSFVLAGWLVFSERALDRLL